MTLHDIMSKISGLAVYHHSLLYDCLHHLLGSAASSSSLIPPDAMRQVRIHSGMGAPVPLALDARENSWVLVRGAPKDDGDGIGEAKSEHSTTNRLKIQLIEISEARHGNRHRLTVEYACRSQEVWRLAG